MTTPTLHTGHTHFVYWPHLLCILVTLDCVNVKLVNVYSAFLFVGGCGLFGCHGYISLLGAELLSILEVLCGDPLYLDNTMIAQVLTHCSHHVANIRSMVSGRGSGCGLGCVYMKNSMEYYCTVEPLTVDTSLIWTLAFVLKNYP